MSASYYYALPDGSTDGPVSLQQIKADILAGMLPQAVQVTLGGDAPWQSVAEAEATAALQSLAGRKASSISSPAKSAAPGVASSPSPAMVGTAPGPQPSAASSAPDSMTGALSAVAFFLLVPGGFCLIAGIINALTGQPIGLPLVALGASAIVSGILFLAAGEALRRLADMAASLRKLAGVDLKGL